MQLLHIKSINAPLIDEVKDEVINSIEIKKEIANEKNNLNEKSSLKVKSQLKNTDQIKTSLNQQPKLKNENSIQVKIKSFEDIVKLANQENEIELKYDLERNVKLVSFKRGKIDISFNEKLNKNFIKILSEKLHTWTGERWIISLNKKIGSKTIFEKKNEKKKNEISEANNNEKIKALLEVFDDANLIDVKKEDNS